MIQTLLVLSSPVIFREEHLKEEGQGEEEEETAVLHPYMAVAAETDVNCHPEMVAAPPCLGPLRD